MFLPHKLKEHREAKNLSQEHAVILLANEFDLTISRHTLGKWEAGITRPDADQLAILVMFYGAKVTSFFNLKLK